MKGRATIIAVLVLTGCVYIGALGFGFVYDDTNQIVNNPTIQSWRYIPRYFTSHVWSHHTSFALYYRPVFLLWLRFNDAVFGLHPAGWHLAAIGVHVLATFLFYLFVKKLSGDRAWIPITAALLFGIHPSHVESVAWISGATDPLMAVFLLSSLLCYTIDGWKWRAASWLFCALAILTKETAVVLPLLIVAYEWIYQRRRIIRSLPYFGMVAISLLLRTLALKSLVPQKSETPLSIIVLSWPNILAFYGKHLLAPYRMSVFYDSFRATPPGIRNFAIPVLCLLLAAAGLYWWSRRSKLIAFFSVWLALMFIPVLDVTLHVTSETVHDRYLYLPSMAFAVLVGQAVSLARAARLARAIALSAIAILACWYAYATISESRPWSSDLALAQRALDLHPENPAANFMRGNALMAAGDASSAIPFLLRDVEKKPFDQPGLWALGFCYLELDSPSEAESYLLRALRESPDDPKTHLAIGMLRFRQNRLAEAEAELRRSIELQRVPEGSQYFHSWLAKTLYAKGDPEGALREYELEPPNTPAGAEAQDEIDKIHRELRIKARERW